MDLFVTKEWSFSKILLFIFGVLRRVLFLYTNEFLKNISYETTFFV